MAQALQDVRAACAAAESAMDRDPTEETARAYVEACLALGRAEQAHLATMLAPPRRKRARHVGFAEASRSWRGR